MKLSAKERTEIPLSEFGLPGVRGYPMPDKSHARNAKSRASEEYSKGNLTRAQFNHINRMADRKLNG
jgi:hypothetical protein